ncbi:MAG: hypothetical protein KPEEDBHJ_03464 [Anaerolineales bacterium]|nr:hypothetical protein [Anaerolineales bacterium]
MIDFTPVREKKATLRDLAPGLGRDDLARELNEMYDHIQSLIREATDADATFQPVDPAADDAYAVEGEESIAWTLGHVIVHLTASMEESAALSAELARGVEFHGRSRWEVDWKTVRTIETCRERLEDSRRMCLAALDMWPREPHLENTYLPSPTVKPYNCIARFLSGLKHASDHLGQIGEILRQAGSAQEEQTA